MKKAAMLLAAAAAIATAAYFLPIKGQWVDASVSGFLSRSSGLRVAAAGVNIRHFSVIEFEAVAVSDPRGRVLCTVGPGASFLKVRPAGGLSVAGFTRKAVLNEDFFKTVGIPALAAENVRFLAVWNAKGLTLRLMRFSSPMIRLTGGARLTGDRWVKGHANVSVRRDSDWFRMRIVYDHDFLTVSGAAGPMLKAHWQSFRSG